MCVYNVGVELKGLRMERLGAQVLYLRSTHMLLQSSP